MICHSGGNFLIWEVQDQEASRFGVWPGPCPLEWNNAVFSQGGKERGGGKKICLSVCLLAVHWTNSLHCSPLGGSLREQSICVKHCTYRRFCYSRLTYPLALSDLGVTDIILMLSS